MSAYVPGSSRLSEVPNEGGLTILDGKSEISSGPAAASITADNARSRP